MAATLEEALTPTTTPPSRTGNRRHRSPLDRAAVRSTVSSGSQTAFPTTPPFGSKIASLTSNTSTNESPGLSSGAIAGIVLVVFLGVFFIAVLMIWCRKPKWMRRMWGAKGQSQEEEYPGSEADQSSRTGHVMWRPVTDGEGVRDADASSGTSSTQSRWVQVVAGLWERTVSSFDQGRVALSQTLSRWWSNSGQAISQTTSGIANKARRRRQEPVASLRSSFPANMTALTPSYPIRTDTVSTSSDQRGTLSGRSGDSDRPLIYVDVPSRSPYSSNGSASASSHSIEYPAFSPGPPPPFRTLSINHSGGVTPPEYSPFHAPRRPSLAISYTPPGTALTSGSSIRKAPLIDTLDAAPALFDGFERSSGPSSPSGHRPPPGWTPRSSASQSLRKEMMHRSVVSAAGSQSSRRDIGRVASLAMSSPGVRGDVGRAASLASIPSRSSSSASVLFSPETPQGRGKRLDVLPMRTDSIRTVDELPLYEEQRGSGNWGAPDRRPTDRFVKTPLG
ncbi:hypothetical protein HDU67_007226 [Dinochytrium kinnereticum]|nr:hypothetical protein HDU67_007226 [Dinochytrium kinnereticum]